MSNPLDYDAIRGFATDAILNTGRLLSLSDGTDTVQATCTIVPAGLAATFNRQSDFGGLPAIEAHQSLAIIDAQPFLDASVTLSRDFEITDDDATVWRLASLEPLRPGSTLVVYLAVVEA